MAIKNKIEQLRLNELNREINFMSNSNKNIYVQQEMDVLKQKIEAAVKKEIQMADRQRYVKPYFSNTQKQPLPPKQYLEKKQEKPLKQIPQTHKPSSTRHFFYQNHVFKGEFGVDEPQIRLQKQIKFPQNLRVNCVVALSPSWIALGAQSGHIQIINMANTSKQLKVRAHDSALSYMKSDGFYLLTAGSDVDYSLKLWDFSQLVGRGELSVLLVQDFKSHENSIIYAESLGAGKYLSADKAGVVNLWDAKQQAKIEQFRIPTGLQHFSMFSNKQSFVGVDNQNNVLCYDMLQSGNGHDFVKVSQMKEDLSVEQVFTFHGNSNLILLLQSTGDFKLLSKNERKALKTITGCQNPIGVFVLNCLKKDPVVLLMALEAYGFKIADVD